LYLEGYKIPGFNINLLPTTTKQVKRYIRGSIMRRNIYYIIVFFVLMLLNSNSSTAQYSRYGPYDTIMVPAYVWENDTIPARSGETVYLAIPRNKMSAYREWNRLKNAVYVTYPYALVAGQVFNDINLQLKNITDPGDRKLYIKSREKELKEKFADKLTNLSVYQGKVLMKLIYRETGNNCYEIIKEMKGGFNATFWQTVAILFGSNLKQDYDATGEDARIEAILQEWLYAGRRG
jgi:hypothetical protein